MELAAVVRVDEHLVVRDLLFWVLLILFKHQDVPVCKICVPMLAHINSELEYL